jgi:pyridoxal phosphate enzyme (YggS family)
VTALASEGAAARRLEIAAGLAAVRDRIAGACADAGRAPGDVTLVVVTKTFPATDVALLHELGVRDVAENRHQEAVEKVAACAGLGLRWHFVGQLQTNKTRAVARYADVVHAVDRPRLVAALDAAVGTALAAGLRSTALDCLIQVDLDQPPRPGRGGAAPADVPALADALAAASHLRLAGVMAVAPLGGDPEEAFGRLGDVARAVRAVHPAAGAVSAGMSGDLESAIRHGATLVRVGSAILGAREATH